MRSTWIAAGLALLFGLVAGRVQATELRCDSLKADTLYQQTWVTNKLTPGGHHWIDSTHVVHTWDAQRMWLTFSAYPAPINPDSAWTCVDTTVVLAVTVLWYECQPSHAAPFTDADTVTTAYETICADSMHTHFWIPSSLNMLSSATVAVQDTAYQVAPGTIAAGANTVGGREIKVVIPVGHNPLTYSNPRSATLHLVDKNGLPFTAPYIRVKYRMINGPTTARIRIILCRVRF